MLSTGFRASESFRNPVTILAHRIIFLNGLKDHTLKRVKEKY